MPTARRRNPAKRLTPAGFRTYFAYDPEEGPKSAARTAAERAVSHWWAARDASALGRGEYLFRGIDAENAILAGGSAPWVKQMGNILSDIREARKGVVREAHDELSWTVGKVEKLFAQPKQVFESAKSEIGSVLDNYLALAPFGAKESDPTVARSAQLLTMLEAALASAAKSNPRRRRALARRRR
jgi:hypothetical protein